MGVYDRDYYRDEPRRGGVGSWSAVATIIAINVAIFIADQFSPELGRRSGVRWLDMHMALYPDLLSHPWNAWQLVTYGFAHDPTSLMHILGNMFALWVFGVDVEAVYGKREFYKIYLSLIVMAGLVWVVLQRLLWPNDPSPTLGASGAVMGIMMVYVFNFPKRTFLFMFAIPMPAWALGAIYIYLDLSGALGGFQFMHERVNNVAHLAGAFFGVIYFNTRWTLFSLLPLGWLSAAFRRPKYRVYRGERNDGGDGRPLQQQVDDILAKISREGEASLTAAERRTLEEASRKYRNQGPRP